LPASINVGIITSPRHSHLDCRAPLIQIVALQEAIESIRDAIREYLSVVDEQLRGEDIREIEVTV
jgi:hypothetical protein